MSNSRKTRVLNWVCVGLVLLSGLARRLWYGTENFSYNMLICTLFTAAMLIWIAQLQRRLVQPEIRKNLTLAVVWMIFWMMVRTVKYVFTGQDSIAERYCWYLYYLPQTFTLLPMFFSVLYIGRPYDQPISRRWNLLYIPAALIALGILTNDFHQLAFRFPVGAEIFSEDNYSHGVLYFISMVWIVVLFLAMVTVVFRRCAVPGNRKKIWMPFVPLGIGALCVATFFAKGNDGILAIFKVPEIVCFVYCAFMECLILARLLPSNDSYDDLWNVSSIGAGIMDYAGTIYCSKAQSIPVTPEQVRQAAQQPVLLQNGSVALHAHPISGGFGFWTKDISAINNLNQELAELGDVLAEENAIMDAENKLAEKRVRIEQQTQLYDSIAESVSTQLDQISAMLDAAPQSEAAFEQTMKYACILITYVKRRSNLFLLQHQSGQIESGEFCLAIAESMEYVRLCGIAAHGDFMGQTCLTGERALLAYALFEAALEAALPQTDAVLVYLQLQDGGLTLRMELNRPRTTVAPAVLQQEIAAQQGSLQTEREGATARLCLTLPAGGAES